MGSSFVALLSMHRVNTISHLPLEKVLQLYYVASCIFLCFTFECGWNLTVRYFGWVFHKTLIITNFSSPLLLSLSLCLFGWCRCCGWAKKKSYSVIVCGFCFVVCMRSKRETNVLPDSVIRSQQQQPIATESFTCVLFSAFWSNLVVVAFYAGVP